MELAHRKCLYRIWHLYTFIICNIWRKHIIAIPAMFGDDTPPGVLLMPSRASVAHGKKVLQCHEESLITVSCGSSSIQRARGSCITVRILQAMLHSRPDWCRATRTQRVSKEFKSSAQLWTLVLYLSEKFPIAEIQALHKLGYIGQSLLNRSII